MTATRAWGRTGQRRAELAEAAARLFHRRGFHHVSMADVAADVGLSAPAVYRHYRNKEELLAGAIGSALDVVEAALDDAGNGPLPEFLDVLAAAAVARADLWVLLQREIRNLGPGLRGPLEERFGDTVRRITAAVAAARPDLTPRSARLVAAAALAVFASPTGYRSPVPVAEQQRWVAAAAGAVCRAAPIGDADAEGPDPDRSVPATRGEELLRAAVRLFAARGYEAVSLDEIAAEVGMAGPSVYHWFATKADILVTAFTRAAARVAAARRPGASLDDLVGAYIDTVARERRALTVYVNDAVSLPDPVRRRVRDEIDADVAAWCAALGAARPELPAPVRPVLVHAARAVVHDLVRLGRWHERPDITTVLRTLAHATLATSTKE